MLHSPLLAQGAPVKLVGYTRVSTQKQGASGLGLEGQLAAINSYAASEKGEIVRIYREVESGRKDDRPELAKAIAHAKRIRGRLVIAKLDRLARDVHFVSGLTKAGVDFVACDNPVANKLTVHILAAVAEDEAERISHRTKAALAAAKARGVLLGSSRPDHWRGREKRRLAGATKGAVIAKARRDAEAEPIYAPALTTIKRLSDEGASLREIAAELNSEGLSTVRGLPWNPMQVSRLMRVALPVAVAVTVLPPL
jgi:DNA invertase Pin-like site-specific DNA recombinase